VASYVGTSLLTGSSTPISAFESADLVWELVSDSGPDTTDVPCCPDASARGSRGDNKWCSRIRQLC
jgi:hypothetical protein